MQTKLTLTIEDKVIGSAKKYAQKRGKSLSHIVENYLKSISTKENKEHTISPKIMKLMGRLKLPKDFDYKTELIKTIPKNM